MQDLSENKTGNEKSLSDSIRKTISSALEQIGYSKDENMLIPDIRFVGEGGLHNADMVAYSSSLRQDADTAVISVKGIEDTGKIQFDSDVSPFRALATPVIVLAEYKAHYGKTEPRVITVGLSKDAATFNREKAKREVIPLSRFEEYLRNKQEHFTPRHLQKAKLVPEQLTIFDIAPNLMKQAIDITNKELVQRFEKGVTQVIESTSDRDKQSVINAAIAVLGARILRDRLRKDWPLSDVNEFLSFARIGLPGYFKVPTGIAGRLSPLLKQLPSSFDFSQIGMDMVGKFYESAFVTEELRDQWGIHYTPTLLANTLLSRMPIEELPPNKRILADPTCGSGSLLVAGYERLANATYLSVPREERHRCLVGSIFGNDNDGVAVDIARMTLMLFHPPHQNNWTVTKLDAESDQFPKRWVEQIGMRPSIIVANPPFGEKGGSKSHPNVPRARHQRDRSAWILNHCLDVLEEGGLLGIILTETILNQILEKDTRHRVLKECQILEQWDIPVGWFHNVDRPAMAWIIRKVASSSKNVFIRCLSNVPSPRNQTISQGTIRVDVSNPPDNLVPTFFEDVLSKMEISQNLIYGHYSVMNGLQAIKSKISKEKIINAHPWSDNARKTNPYLDLSNGDRGWLELIDENLREGRKRKDLRVHLERNEPMVMLRANRTAPWKCKWSSVALIDMPEGSRKIVAPSESFDATFSKSESDTDKKNYIYALWAILNHPLASLWFHERQRGNKIPINNYRRKFPLPREWNTENVQFLASFAKELIDVKRNVFLQDNQKIENLVNKIDDSIYQMYEINKGEKLRIETWFGAEQRPLLKDICETRNSERKPDAFTSITSINYEQPEWETTCETLEVRFVDEQIRLAIDGLGDYPKQIESPKDGIWMKIIPSMPGWLLEKGIVGWVELTTDSAKKLGNYPEKYILGFHLHKNAYKTQDEIDKELLLFSEMEKAVDGQR